MCLTKTTYFKLKKWLGGSQEMRKGNAPDRQL